jgi:hypothetical protein
MGCPSGSLPDPERPEPRAERQAGAASGDVEEGALLREHADEDALAAGLAGGGGMPARSGRCGSGHPVRIANR